MEAIILSTISGEYTSLYGKRDFTAVTEGPNQLTLKYFILNYPDGPNITTWTLKIREQVQMRKAEYSQRDMLCWYRRKTHLCCEFPGQRVRLLQLREITSWQSVKKPNSFKELHSANNLNKLGSGFFPRAQMRAWLTDALILTLTVGAPFKHTPTSDLQNSDLTNECCVKPLSLLFIYFYGRKENWNLGIKFIEKGTYKQNNINKHTSTVLSLYITP